MSQTDYENNEAIRLGPIPNSKELSFGSKGIEFAHQFTGGELALNLNSALNTPSIMSGNGFVNASPAEIASAYLGTFKKKLRLSLSRGIELKPYIHYVVTGNTIVFVGALRDTGGAQAGEIIFGQIEQVKANGMIVGDMRWFHGTVEVAVGQTLVNIGVNFKVNENADFQVGDVKLKQNGTSIYRNVGNATAGPTADGHYQENDAGNGYGTTVTLNAAPVGQPALIEYEVGVKLSSGDAQIWSDLERLEGSIIALSEDAAQGFYGDNDLTRYITSSPAAIERRGFGDLVQSALVRIGLLEASQPHLFVRRTASQSFPNASSTTPMLFETVDEDDASGYNPLTGIYTLPKKGRWLFTTHTAAGSGQAWAAGQEWSNLFTVNGSYLCRIGSSYAQAAHSVIMQTPGSLTRRLPQGAQVSVNVFQTRGANTANQVDANLNYFTATWLGE